MYKLLGSRGHLVAHCEENHITQLYWISMSFTKRLEPILTRENILRQPGLRGAQLRSTMPRFPRHTDPPTQCRWFMHEKLDQAILGLIQSVDVTNYNRTFRAFQQIRLKKSKVVQRCLYSYRQRYSSSQWSKSLAITLRDKLTRA